MKFKNLVFAAALFLVWTPQMSTAQDLYTAVPTYSQSSSTYVIGIYEPQNSSADLKSAECRSNRGGAVPITVGPTERPITLIVSAYGCTDWKIQRLRGSRIERIIVNGYHAATVSGVPESLIERHTYDQDGEYLGAFPYNPTSRRFVPYDGVSCSERILEFAPEDQVLDCSFTKLERLLFEAGQQSGVTTYRSFQGDYYGSDFSVGAAGWSSPPRRSSFATR